MHAPSPLHRLLRGLHRPFIPAALFLLVPVAAASVDDIDYGQPYLRSLRHVAGAAGGIEPVFMGDRLLVPIDYGGFAIYRVDDPDRPVFETSFAASGVRGGCALGDIVVLARGAAGITIVDASVTPPVLLATLDTPGDAGSVASSTTGAYVFVADGAGGTQAVSLADPVHPAIVANVPAPAGGAAYDITVAGNFALVAAGSAGVQSIEITVPAAPVERDVLAATGYVFSIAALGTRAYAVGGGTLKVIEAANPRDLQLKGSATGVAWLAHVSVHGTHAFATEYFQWGIAPGPARLAAFDVSDAAHPRYAGNLRELFYDAGGVAARGSRGYVPDRDGGLVVIDAVNPEAPPLVSRVPSGGSTLGAGADDRFAYLVETPVGGCGMVSPYLRIIDLADPASPVETGVTEFPWCCALWLNPAAVASGGRLYVPIADELDIMSVAGGWPSVLGTVGVSGWTEALAVDMTTVFVAAGEAGLKVVDASDPAHPAIVAGYHDGGEARDVRVRNGLAFVASGPAGLDVVDVSDPAAPVRLARLPLDGEANGIALDGPFAFVAAGPAGLVIVDVSDPAHPRVAGALDTPGDGRRVDVFEGIAYVADGHRGIRVIDVHDVAAPAEIGSIPVSDGAIVVSVRNRLLHVAGGYEGYQVRPLQSRTITASVASPAARGAVGPRLRVTPNPAPEPGVLLSLATEGALAGRFCFRIHDVTGRLLRRIDTDAADVAWDGRDEAGRRVASGVYMVRVEWAGGSATGRIVLSR